MHLTEGELVENLLILLTDLGNLSLLDVLARSNHIDICWSGNALASSEDALTVVGQLERSPVRPVVGQLTYHAFAIYTIHVLATMPYADEIEHGSFVFCRSPAEGIDI